MTNEQLVLSGKRAEFRDDIQNAENVGSGEYLQDLFYNPFRTTKRGHRVANQGYS